MGFFNTKRAESALNYNAPEQGEITPPIAPGVKKTCDCEHCEKFDKLLANQDVIVRNQQIILDNITPIQQMIINLMQEVQTEEQADNEEVEELEEEEVSEDDLRAALTLIRQRKAETPPMPTIPIKRKLKRR